MMPGASSGRVTCRKVPSGVAPRSFAASSRLRSKPIRRERTTTTTKLMENMTWAISRVSKPSEDAEDDEDREQRGADHDLGGRHRDHDQEVRQRAGRRTRGGPAPAPSGCRSMVAITVASSASLRLVSSASLSSGIAEGVAPVVEGEARPR